MTMGIAFNVGIHQPCVGIEFVAEIVEWLEGGLATNGSHVGVPEVVLAVVDIVGGNS